MILTVFHGFCMALVDSVPGVSGGTLASIPFIAAAERTALKRLRGALFALLDMAVVVLTLLRGSSALGSVSFASLSPLSLLYIFSSSSTNASGSKGAPSSRIRTIRLPSSKRRQMSIMLTCSLWLMVLRAASSKAMASRTPLLRGMPFCWQKNLGQIL